jgi:hypothetical protein
MKLNLIPMLIATVSVTYAAPEGLQSGIPAFLDTDGDGIISEVERQAFVESRKTAPRGGASDWDTNGDGVIDEDERQAAIEELRAKADERRAALFASVAGDDGLLDFTEFAALPALSNMPIGTKERLFNLLDVDGDGTVPLEDFLAGIRPTPPTTPPNIQGGR